MLVFFLLALASVLATALGKGVLELQATNFELALSSYKYIAILFYNAQSPSSQRLLALWKSSASRISSLYRDGELAVVDAAGEDATELIEAFALPVPGIRVFRNGIMADYRGPYDSEGMAAYLIADSEPSVRELTSQTAVRSALQSSTLTVVLGFFPHSSTHEDPLSESADDEWTQLNAAADNLRGHAVFFVVRSVELRALLNVPGDMPTIRMVVETADDGYSLLPFKGPLTDSAISEWVLKNGAPSMGELSFSSSAGELYANHFFSSPKLKFILFLGADDVAVWKEESGASVLADWQAVSAVFRNNALFSYMIGTAVPDVSDYFAVTTSDLPIVVAHDPSKDAKFKSTRLASLDLRALQEFVAGVMSGYVKKVIKSEPIPKTSAKSNKKSAVHKTVGLNVMEVVSDSTKDVLLEVYAPWCAHCKKLRPTYQVLSKALQGDDRFVIAQIDGSVNDLPTSWDIKGFPALLFFPARDKPYMSDVPIPRVYQGGHSLHDLVAYLTKHSSFDQKTLRIATSEQLGTLLGDEEQLRLEFEAEDRWIERNQGRTRFADSTVDFFAGEVVFDGVRWHVCLLGLALVYAVVVTVYLLCYSRGSSTKGSRAKAKKSE